ncbi:hypothetical protein HFN54_35790 [Rhizobium leguminosarum]|nr:hypothetical protein [Rhizobium leguminosarum]
MAAVRSLEGTTGELFTLSAVMLTAAAAGVFASALSMNVEKLARPMMLAIGVVAIAAFGESTSANPHDLWRFYVSQAGIAFAGTFFLGPAPLLGITNALQYGSRELFGVVNALGALAGPALLGSYMDGRVAAGAAPLTAQSDTLHLVAALAALTTAYLAVILALRIRRKMAEPRIQRSANTVDQPAAAGARHGASSDGGWQPPRRGRGVTAALAAIAIGGALLVLAAWRLP